ncbi:hypothetical protein BGX33_003943 [Mortierella sp. NVP41]|nr:hypothetical protein BGX33_003943 [Mortierella sp. NVP41]
MTSTTATAALTIADQDIFATSAEWDTQSQAESTRMSSSTSEPTDKQSSVFATMAQPESEPQSAESEYDIDQDRQFQKFLRRFGEEPPTMLRRQLEEWARPATPPRQVTLAITNWDKEQEQEQQENNEGVVSNKASEPIPQRNNLEEAHPRTVNARSTQSSSSTPSRSPALSFVSTSVQRRTHESVDRQQFHSVASISKDASEVGRRHRTPSSSTESRSRGHEIVINTQKNHLHYQRHWKEWCARKRYQDKDKVTGEKLAAYMREGTARDGYEDKANPHLSIRPFRVKSSYGIRRASGSSVRAYLLALRALYKDQCGRAGIVPNQNMDLWKDEIDAIMRDHAKLLEELSSQKNLADGIETGQYEEEEEEEGDDGEDDDLATTRDSESSRKRKAMEEEGPRKRDAKFSSSLSTAQNVTSTSTLSSTARHGIATTVTSTSPREEPRENSSESSAARGEAIHETNGDADEEGEEEDEDEDEEIEEEEEEYREQQRKPQSQPRARPERKYNRTSKLSDATMKNYRASQKHWKEWCIRKKYPDGDKVTRQKFLLYGRELTAREVYHDVNPQHSVIPLFVRARNGQKGEAIRASLSSMANFFAAIRTLYNEQCRARGVTPKSSDLPRGLAMEILKEYKAFLKNPSALKVRASRQDEEVEQETYHEAEQETPHEAEHDNNAERRDKDIAMDQCKKKMRALWTSPPKDPSQHSWKTVARDRFCLAFDQFKGDPQLDAAVIPLNHLYLLHVPAREDEHVFTTGVAVAKNFNKAYTNHSRYSFLLRETDVDICPVSALAFHLLAKLSDGDTMPEFHEENWGLLYLISDDKAKPRDRSWALEGGSDSATATATSSQATVAENTNTGELLSDGRAMKNLKAGFLPGYGRAHELYMLTTTLSKSSAIQLPRNRVIPPAKLQRQLFPFIEEMFPDNDDWRIWIENIMMDRFEGTTRPSSQQASYKRASYSGIRFMVLLARLRKVILQDFAVMLTSEGGDGEGGGGAHRAGHGHVFATRFPVLSSTAFQDFASQLRDAMAEGPVEKSRTPTTGNRPPTEDAVQRLSVQQNYSNKAAATLQQTHDDNEGDSFTNTTADHSNQSRRDPPTLRRPLVTTTARFSADPVSQSRVRGGDLDLRQENQILRDKVASLEQEVKHLSYRNHQTRQYHHSQGQSSTANAAALSSHTDAVVDQDDGEEPAQLRQVIQTLRNQLALEEQEKMEAMESVALLDEEVAEMEQSMHGLWTMVAKAEAAKFAARPKTLTPQMRQDQHHLLRTQLDALRSKIAANGKMRAEF